MCVYQHAVWSPTLSGCGDGSGCGLTWLAAPPPPLPQELHLQEVITAQQTNHRHQIYIPTPEATITAPHYNTLYKSAYDKPSQYIRVPGRSWAGWAWLRGLPCWPCSTHCSLVLGSAEQGCIPVAMATLSPLVAFPLACPQPFSVCGGPPWWGGAWPQAGCCWSGM